MSAEHDRDLEQLFRTARAEAESQSPSFAAVLERQPAPHRQMHPGVVLALAAGLMLAVAGVWRFTRPNVVAPVIAFTPGDMRVPTDYLLDLVTYPAAGAIPRIGGADWYPVPMASDASPDTRRRP